MLVIDYLKYPFLPPLSSGFCGPDWSMNGERKDGRARPHARFEYGLLGPHVTEFQSQMFFQAHPLPLAPPARLGCVRLKLNYI